MIERERHAFGLASSRYVAGLCLSDAGKLMSTQRRVRYIMELSKVISWLLVVSIVVLSLGPPGTRPVSPAPHSAEHLMIFFAMSLAFGLAYPKRVVPRSAALLTFTLLIEIAQVYMPGRHARLSDFVVGSLGCVAGAALALARSTYVERTKAPMIAEGGGTGPRNLPR